MIRNPALTLCLAILVAATVAAAEGTRAVNINAFAGAGYLLTVADGTTPAPPTSLFDFSAGLRINGGLLNPGLLRYSLGVSYLGSRGTVYRGTSAANLVGFHAHLIGLSMTPLTLTFVASRSFSDITTGPAEARIVGNSATTVIEGGGTFRLKDRPTLFATLGRTMVDTEHAAAERTFMGSTRLATGLSQSFSRFDYGANYDTSWTNGTYAEQNYTSHMLSARGSADLSGGDVLKLNIYDSYYLRVPLNDLPGNPRFDTNNMGAGLQWRASTRLTATLSYTHVQTLITAPTAPLLNNRAQNVQETVTYKLLDGLYLNQSLGFLYAKAVVGTESRAGLGESLGLGLLWQRPQPWGAIGATLGGNIGLVQPDTGGLELSYGGQASGTLTRIFGKGSGTAAYSIGYSFGGPAVSGYTLQQLARIEANYRPVEHSLVRLYFNAAAARREDTFLGTFFNRGISANLDGNWTQHAVQLSGGITDGVDAALINPAASDGLFLPVAYNTHTKFLQLTASTTFDGGRLGLRLSGRLAENTAPNRPAEMAGGVTAAAWYTIGKFRLTVEDRLLLGGGGGATYRENVLMIRLTRDFSWEIKP